MGGEKAVGEQKKKGKLTAERLDCSSTQAPSRAGHVRYHRALISAWRKWISPPTASSRSRPGQRPAGVRILQDFTSAPAAWVRCTPGRSARHGLGLKAGSLCGDERFRRPRIQEAVDLCPDTARSSSATRHVPVSSRRFRHHGPTAGGRSTRRP